MSTVQEHLCLVLRNHLSRIMQHSISHTRTFILQSLHHIYNGTVGNRLRVWKATGGNTHILNTQIWMTPVLARALQTKARRMVAMTQCPKKTR
jgi:hypothetical protein